MAGIFISYRHDTASGWAGRLHEALGRHFGRQQVFRDLDLSGGVAFAEALDSRAATCDAMVVLIDADWLGVDHTNGRRRLDDPADWVRREVLGGLEIGVLVVPVLLDDATMPSPQELPGELAALAGRQALRLADRTWDQDVERLIEDLERDMESGRRILRATAPPSLRQPGPVADIPCDRRTPLVDRRDEITWLDNLWQLAQDNSRQIAVIRGAKGLGKTRLAAEWTTQATPQGRVLYGDAEASGLFQPFAGALRTHLGALPPEGLRWVLGQEADLIARIVPELVPNAPSRSTGEKDRGPDRRDRLFAAVRLIVERLSKAHPTVLIIDNAHSIDEDGLALLQVLLTLDDTPLLVVLLSRPYGGTPFELALPQILSDHHVLQETQLAPLDDEQSREMVMRLTGEEPAPGVLRAAQGTPVRLETFAVRPPGRRTHEADPERSIVAALDEKSRRLANIGAVGPNGMSTAVFARAAQLDSEETAELLGRLADVNLLVGEPPGILGSGMVSWRFTHAVRRQAVLDMLDSADAKKVAGVVADALEAEPDRDPADLADLYERAGIEEKARQFWFAAAQEAERSFAYERAANLYRKCLHYAPVGSATAQGRCQLGIRIGTCLWQSGRFRDARASFAVAANLATEENLPIELAEAALGRAGRIGFEGPTGDAEVVQNLRLAFSLLGDRDDRLKARVLAATAHAVTFSGESDLEEAQALVGQAQTLARDQDDAQLLAEVLCTTSWAMWTPDNLARRQELAEEAVTLADLVHHEVLQIESRLFRITCCLEIGNVYVARVDVDEIVALADVVRSPYYLAMTAMVRAALGLLDGTDTGEPAVRRALEMAQREHNPALVRVFAAQIFYTRLLQGRLEELRTCAEGFADYDKTLVAWRAGLAVIYAETGRREEASIEFEAMADQRFASLPRNMLWLIMMDNLARVCQSLGDCTRAKELIELLTPYEDRFVVAAGAGAIHGPVTLSLGVLNAMCGNYPEADRLLRHAHQRAKSVGCLPASAEAAVERAYLRTLHSTAGSLGLIVSGFREALDEVKRVKSPKLASRLAEAIELMIPLAEAQDDPAEVANLHALAAQTAELAETEERPKMRRIVRGTVAPVGRAVTKLLVGGRTDEQLEKDMGTSFGQTVLLSAMVRFFQPSVAHPFRGTVVLRLTMLDPAAEPLTWALKVGQSSAERLDEVPSTPDLLVRLRAIDYLRLVTGRINAVEEWLEGRIYVKGDPILAGRLVEMFGGPAPFRSLGSAGE